MRRYAITDRHLFSPEHWQRDLYGQVEGWVASGVEWVQLREKDLPLPDLAALTRALSTLTSGTKTKFLVNGLPLELALENGADGIHLPASVLSETEMPGLVTVSCHTLAGVEARRAADAILWAPVFGKTVHGRQVLPGTGLAALNAACGLAHPTPVFALGGITPGNAQACVDAGAAGVAGIRLFHGEGRRLLV